MVSLIEQEVVTKRNWLSKQQLLDILGVSHLIPGPNSVEVVMYIGFLRRQVTGLVIAGICYILPSTLICLALAILYRQYGTIALVKLFLFGTEPATAALVAFSFFGLINLILKKKIVLFTSVLVFVGALIGVDIALLVFGALAIGFVSIHRNSSLSVILMPSLCAVPDVVFNATTIVVFLKIGALIYGNGYVLFAYLNESLVANGLITRKELIDVITVGQASPGPILSCATFAGYLFNGLTGAIMATIGIYLPAFFISFTIGWILKFMAQRPTTKYLLDFVNGASIALIGSVAGQMGWHILVNWQQIVVFAVSLSMLYIFKPSPLLIIFTGGVLGFLLGQI